MTGPSTGGRPSAIQPQVKLERRVSPFFATFFYGFIAAAAFVWLSAGERVDPFAPWASQAPLRDIAIGAGGAALLIGLWLGLVRFLSGARELEKEFGWILGEQRPAEIVYLALLSGAAEEYLFRGALHVAIGPILSTALFAAVHWPVNWSFRLWPLVALFAGGLMAGELMWTGSLVAPAVTHAVVNGVTLFRLRRRYGAWKE